MIYYNEFDPKAAAWLRALMMEGEIPVGFVDERSITDLDPDELKSYAQCHFFAGIGGWSLALRLAGWPESRPAWTGSCPCQPFSNAGKQMGTDDSRHLWPAFRRLINRCKPPVVFGEQVASSLGRGWLAGVRSDLETMGYAAGGADLCAAGVGAPHIRQRLYWVAHHHHHQGLEGTTGAGLQGLDSGLARSGELGGLAHGLNAGLEGHAGHEPNGNESGRVGADEIGPTPESSGLGWGESRAHLCRDGKCRRVPIEPAFFPLAHGFSGVRVGLLRGAGNAIVPELAAEFIRASEEAYNLSLSLL